MSEVEDLKKRIDNIEYSELKELKEDVGQIKIDLSTNNLLTKQSIESNNKLSGMIDTMRDTLVEMGQSLRDGNRISSELANSVSSLNDKVNKVEDKLETKLQSVDTRIDKLDEKAKIDWQEWIKHNWLTLGVIVVGGAYLVAKALGVSFWF